MNALHWLGSLGSRCSWNIVRVELVFSTASCSSCCMQGGVPGKCDHALLTESGHHLLERYDPFKRILRPVAYILNGIQSNPLYSYAIYQLFVATYCTPTVGQVPANLRDCHSVHLINIQCLTITISNPEIRQRPELHSLFGRYCCVLLQYSSEYSVLDINRFRTS